MKRLALAPAALVLAALLAAAAPRPARALGASRKGTSGAQFLELAPGARPAAMGQAFAGVADDVEAVYYNPAGLGNLRRVEATGSHDAMFQGLQYDFAAAAVPALTWSRAQRDKSDFGVLGVSVYSLGISGLERRGLVETDAPVGTFDASNMAFALSYGVRPFGGRFSLGATVKSVQVRIDSVRGSAAAFDGGALYRGDRWSWGAGVRDAGGGLRLGTASDPLPTTLFAGAAYQLTLGWLASAELDAPRDGPAALGLGAEYRTLVTDHLAASARAGYDSANADAGSFSGVCGGVGLTYGAVSFDFAFAPFGDLGSTYKYTLRTRF